MNILLVDDNTYVLEGLYKGIDFKTLGFDNVFSAQSSGVAKEIIKTVKIHIVLTDIEMPAESGLKLLEWINGYDPGIVTLFCTSYADFNYAQEAVRLHSFDYYLKPIRYEQLTERLKKAVEEVGRRTSIKESAVYEQYWKENVWNMRVDFWSKMLCRINLMKPEELWEEVQGRRLDYSRPDLFTLCLVKLGVHTSKWQYLSTSMQEFIIRNIVEEIFGCETVRVDAVFKNIRDGLMIVFKQLQKVPQDFWNEHLKKLADSLNCFLADYCCFYYYKECALETTFLAVRKLEEIFQDDVTSETIIVEGNDYRKKEIKDSMIDMEVWEKLLQERRKEELFKQVEVFFNEHRKRGLRNSRYLKAVRANVMQVIYAVLKSNKIEAHNLFANEEAETLFIDSVNSAELLKKYLFYLIDKSIDYMKSTDTSENVVQKVLKYIDDNYNKELTRSHLGENIYININHLAKIFKEETGKSLYSYLLDKRVEKAKEMLMSSQRSVSEIALAVGYDNFSYFSRLFKEKTGYSPKDYRKLKKE